MRGDRVGLIGPNGSGKTTLLRLLLGESAAAGRHGSPRDATWRWPTSTNSMPSLDETKSVRENVRDGSDSVTVNGRTRHIVGYLEDFLFTPDQAGGPVARLSGGERNRLLLARLFTQPSNVLVMDEPTNDLDLETLELLEDLLSEYAGTLLLVSHDREFLNNVVTSTLVSGGRGPGQGICGRLRRLVAAAARRAAANCKAGRRPAGAWPEAIAAAAGPAFDL